MGLPIHSHACFGKTFVFDPRSKINGSISYSSICVVNLISLLDHVMCLSSFRTTQGSPDLAHLVMSSCSPFTDFLSRKIFMKVSRKVISIDGSISSSSLSLLLEMEVFVKLFLASINFSFVCPKLNFGSFVGALRT